MPASCEVVREVEVPVPRCREMYVDIVVPLIQEVPRDMPSTKTINYECERLIEVPVPRPKEEYR